MSSRPRQPDPRRGGADGRARRAAPHAAARRAAPAPVALARLLAQLEGEAVGAGGGQLVDVGGDRVGQVDQLGGAHRPDLAERSDAARSSSRAAARRAAQQRLGRRGPPGPRRRRARRRPRGRAGAAPARRCRPGRGTAPAATCDRRAHVALELGVVEPRRSRGRRRDLAGDRVARSPAAGPQSPGRGRRAAAATAVGDAACRSSRRSCHAVTTDGAGSSLPGTRESRAG